MRSKVGVNLSLSMSLSISLLVGLLFLAPLAWLLIGSLQPPGQLPQSQPGLVLSGPATPANYWQIFQRYDLGRPLINSLLVELLALPLTLITASAAGFAMAQLPTSIRRALLLLTIILMIVPIPALWLPRFVMFSALGLIDHLVVLVAPALMGSSPFFVLLYYWTFRRMGSSLFEAARLDGAGWLRTWWRVALPLSRAATVVVAVLTFGLYWGDYMSALVYLRSEALYTLPLRLQQFMTQDVANQPLAMAVTVLAIVPMVVLFVGIQRYLWPEGRS